MIVLMSATYSESDSGTLCILTRCFPRTNVPKVVRTSLIRVKLSLAGPVSVNCNDKEGSSSNSMEEEMSLVTPPCGSIAKLDPVRTVQ